MAMYGYFPYKIPRNSANNPLLLQEGWGQWCIFMEPYRPGFQWIPRENGIGWQLQPEELWYRVPEATAGIYELALLDSSDNINVVYVGMTQDQDEYGKLVHRMNQYMVSGAHKAEEINNALMQGNAVAFSFKAVTTPAQAHTLERILLDTYDYPWNVQHN